MKAKILLLLSCCLLFTGCSSKDKDKVKDNVPVETEVATVIDNTEPVKSGEIPLSVEYLNKCYYGDTAETSKTDIPSDYLKPEEVPDYGDCVVLTFNSNYTPIYKELENKYKDFEITQVGAIADSVVFISYTAKGKDETRLIVGYNDLTDFNILDGVACENVVAKDTIDSTGGSGHVCE